MRTKVRHRQDNDRWYVSVTIDGHEEAAGGYRTKREATAAAAALRTDASRGRYTSPTRLTVAGYLEGEWLPSRANADISPNTRDVEAITVRAWILPHIGHISLQKLAARDIDRLYATLRARGGRGGTPLRGKSVRNVHVLLSKALGDAVRRGHLVVNPVGAVDPPSKGDSVERTAWSPTEVRAFLDVAGADRLHAVWRVALAAGLRRGEIVGITWDAIEERTIEVRRQVLIRPGGGAGGVYVRETTKGRRTRRVRIDEQTAAALRRWKAEQAEGRLAFGAAWKTDGGLGVEAAWVVTEPDGSIIQPDTLLARWKRLVKVAGVTPIGLHGARHSYTTLARRAGVPLEIVSRQLGHASIATTGDIYSHDSDEAAEEAAELVARTIEGR
jgi:integrase